MSEKCGTYAGYNAHNYRGEKVCDDCREAARIYQATRRAKGGAQIEDEYLRQRARERALWRLKDMHRKDFDLLVEDEVRVERAIRRREKQSA